MPAGASDEHHHADAEEHDEELGRNAELLVEQLRKGPLQEGGDHRAPDAVHPTHQHHGEQDDRSLHRELGDGDTAR